MPERKQGPARGLVRFTTVLERSDNNLWGAHVRVPSHIADKFTGTGTRRIVCTLNGSAEHQCAILPFGNGAFVVTVNKRLRDSHGLKFGDEVEVGVRKDDSKYGLPLPEELQEVLRQDAVGSTLFHALTPGRRRTLLYIVGSAKTPDKRIARSVVIMTHLKANKGKINYRQLYGMLKDLHR